MKAVETVYELGAGLKWFGFYIPLNFFMSCM